MHHKSLLLLLLFATILTACTKNEPESTYKTSNYDFVSLAIKSNESQASATKKIENLGEETWLFNTSSIYINGYDAFSLSCAAYEDTINCSARESINFIALTLKEGRIVLPNKDNADGLVHYVRLLGDGDVGDAIWNIIENSGSYIDVAKIDTIEQKISGTFEVHFLRAELTWEPLHPYSDKISFLEGEFEVDY